MRVGRYSISHHGLQPNAAPGSKPPGRSKQAPIGGAGSKAGTHWIRYFMEGYPKDKVLYST